jgi:cell division protein FtsI/penicillin-binding protein 2
VKRKRFKSRSPRRLVSLFVVFVLAFGAMATRLVSLQIIDGPAYAARASEQRSRQELIPARRGAIFDRSGEPLAISVDLQTLWTDPSQVEDPAATAERIAPILDRDPAEIQASLIGSVPGDQFEYIARRLEPKVAHKIEGLDLPGLYFLDEPERLYPGTKLASHVLGFVDTDGQGISGIEQQFEGVLEGKAGEIVFEQDPSGQTLWQADFQQTRAKPGRAIFLTIDKELQYFTQATLAEAAAQYGAESGSAIVMRPRTGEILAMANVPDFDPNDPGGSEQEMQRNRAVTDMYEPGSIYKMVTLAAALEEKTVTPKTKFTVPSSFIYAGEDFNDSHSHATMSMSVSDIIKDSSNVGTIQMALKLGGKKLLRYIKSLGFGSATGLDFPGESPGIVPEYKDWTPPTIATLPIGQGIAVTPLQMAVAYSAIANGGKWVEPKIVAGTMRGEGGVEPSPRGATRRVISEKTAGTVTDILTRVVDEGTGTAAQVPGYRVAGKTGTPQKADGEGAYLEGSYIASFAGFAPADRPEIAVIVMLDGPVPYYGGLTAAPTFRTITEFALRHLNVSPTGNAEQAAAEIEADANEQAPAHD